MHARRKIQAMACDTQDTVSYALGSALRKQTWVAKRQSQSCGRDTAGANGETGIVVPISVSPVPRSSSGAMRHGKKNSSIEPRAPRKHSKTHRFPIDANQIRRRGGQLVHMMERDRHGSLRCGEYESEMIWAKSAG